MRQLDIDPDWTIFRQYDCGHFQFACCAQHLDDECPKCPEVS